ncbi:NAD(P)H-quinone oxidoreductase subunit T, chloroplastic [Impatiens glandulifera]|uniref:NAD(P)H-quinone oxidoreductase subunit T, chloroplastic n=1 Tax=Impatiens glandulifera TaxID=253017 RepID=UPI001FB11D48|nr:NAD(P)H-quinone oxidoreductase subunit T, chloroplastic [Impatiens glandulifera]
MAFTAAPCSQTSYTHPLKLRDRNKQLFRPPVLLGRTQKEKKVTAAAAAAGGKESGPGPNTRPQPGVDTRIHWENDEEGWIGGSNRAKSSDQEQGKSSDPFDLLGEKNFSELLSNYSDSHYQFLGIAPDADLEDIKAAYRRLTKEYHPDTTSLPIKAASEMFMKLREVYNVLSDEEKRGFYDWTLAQEAASREAEKLRVRFEDPQALDLEKFESVPDMVDRLEGKNMPLSDQAMSALTFDILIIVFSVCCIVYVAFFKEPY